MLSARPNDPQAMNLHRLDLNLLVTLDVLLAESPFGQNDKGAAARGMTKALHGRPAGRPDIRKSARQRSLFPAM
jgi:hypothetical protein